MTKVRDSLRERENKNVRLDRILTIIFVVIIVISLAIVILFSHVFFLVKVDGPSMQNTFYTGEALIVNKKLKATYGDVVIIDRGQDLIIKRVIGLEGDKIRIEEGKVYLTKNGKQEEELVENYVKEPNSTFTAGPFELTVGEGQVFYLGDNRAQSADARQNGCCSEKAVLGVVTDFAIKIKGVTTWIVNVFGGSTVTN